MLNRESDVPIYIQIQEQLEEMLLDGTLKANDLVPSEHEFAEKLKVSRLTVRKSYAEMVKRDLFYTIQGKGTYVKEDYQTQVPPIEQTRRKKVIGVILPEVHGFFGDVFASIRTNCDILKFSVVLMFNDEVKNEITAIKQMLAIDVVGIIIAPSRSANTIIEHYQKLLSTNIPIVMIGKPPFKIGDTAVFCDDVFASYRAVELLIEHENKRIGYVTSNLYTDESAKERYEGYADALADYLPTCTPISYDLNSPNFANSIKEAVSMQEPVTAFFCYCDAAASILYTALLQLGKKVPEDIEIIGYDNVHNCDNYGMLQKLTTVDQRRDLLGCKAVQLLCMKLQQGEEKHTHTQIVIHPKLVIRETTRSE